MNDGEVRVGIEWEPPVGGGGKTCVSHTDHLGQKPRLCVAGSDMFDDRIAVGDVKRMIIKRQVQAIGGQDGDLRKGNANGIEVGVTRDGRNLFRERIGPQEVVLTGEINER